MEQGEKYLDIKLVGHEFVRAFPNKEKKSEKSPDYQADGIAVWVREVKPKAPESKKNSPL